MNGVVPYACLKAPRETIAAGHPAAGIDERPPRPSRPPHPGTVGPRRQLTPRAGGVASRSALRPGPRHCRAPVPAAS